MHLGRRLIWLGILGLLLGPGLAFLWLACVMVGVSHYTATRPEMLKLYQQAQQTISVLTPTSSDQERVFELMAPIFSQLNWGVIAVVTGMLGFGIIGFLYGRVTGSIDLLGTFPIMSLLTGQNPITMAMSFSAQGVAQAKFSHPFEVVLLVTQLLSLYGMGALGMWFHQRKLASRPSVTTR